MPILQLAKFAWALANSKDWGLIAAKEGFYLFARGRPSQLPISETKRLIDEDYRKLKAASLAADQHFVPWSMFLTGAFTWRDLFGWSDQ